MAATRVVEEERGTYVGFVHAHNGYYAGDFSRRADRPTSVRRNRVYPTFPERPVQDPWTRA
jgi:hypothetical protein